MHRFRRATGLFYFAADVLAGNGRLAMTGGEYNTPGNGYDLQLTNQGSVYDPIKNTWTPLGHPQKWKYIGDSPSSVLPNGNMLVGDKLHMWDAYLNPKTLAWKSVADAGKSDFNAEEGWTLLPNGTSSHRRRKERAELGNLQPSDGSMEDRRVDHCRLALPVTVRMSHVRAGPLLLSAR